MHANDLDEGRFVKGKNKKNLSFSSSLLLLRVLYVLLGPFMTGHLIWEL